jgi:uncharacterized protein
MNNIIEKAKAYVNKHLGDEITGHDYFHALRVYDMAMYLAVGKEVDVDIIGLAAILHDLDDEKITQNKNLVKKFFEENSISDSAKSAVYDIINNMSFRDYQKGKNVTSLEGKIVQDADRLDALGAIGIARVFSYSGKLQRMIYKNSIDDDSAIAHFYQKLFLLPDLMNLDEARVIAEERVEFMKEFLSKFYQEWK